jgi:hypothetical protein
MANWKPPKLRWLILALLAYWVWHACSKASLETAGKQLPGPAPVLQPAPVHRRPRALRKVLSFQPPAHYRLTPIPTLAPEPQAPKALAAPRPAHESFVAKVKARLKREPTATPEPVIHGAEPQLELQGTPTSKPKSLFEQLAFENPKQARALLGEPDAKLLHLDEDGQSSVESWYYLHNDYDEGGGEKNCPELRFVDGQVRFVVFWTPQAMQSLVSDARTRGAQKSGPMQDFSFKDGFRYLGVGTPKDTLLEDLGEPDAKRSVEGGKEAWDYDTLLVEDGAPKRLTVILKDAKVVEVRNRQ